MGLSEVSRFEFGESYLLVVGSLTTDYPELDDLLELMGDMFRLEASTYAPSVKVYSYAPSVKVYRHPIGFGPNVRVRATLHITPVRFGLPASDDWIEGIRKRVTHYNLSGNWDYFETENL